MLQFAPDSPFAQFKHITIQDGTSYAIKPSLKGSEQRLSLGHDKLCFVKVTVVRDASCPRHLDETATRVHFCLGTNLDSHRPSKEWKSYSNVHAFVVRRYLGPRDSTLQLGLDSNVVGQSGNRGGLSEQRLSLGHDKLCREGHSSSRRILPQAPG